MFSKPFGYGLLAVFAVAAVGGGAYLAVRQNDAALRSAATAILAEQVSFESPGNPAELIESAPVVEETEALIEDEELMPPARGESEPPTRPLPEPERPEPSPADVAVLESTIVPVPEPVFEPEPVTVEPAFGDLAEAVPDIENVEVLGDEATLEYPEIPVDEYAAPWPENEAVDASPSSDPWAFDPGLLPVYEELIVSADSVIGLQIETRVSSEDAEVEDPVDARVTRDVMAGNQIAIPSGTRILGSVVLVERGGKMSARARLGVRFHTLVFADSSEVSVTTDTIYREGASQGKKSAGRIGGAAVSGAILGAIFGGRRGAILGGSVGAAGGTASVMTGDRNRTTLLPGMTFTVRLLEPATVTVQN